MTGERDYTVAVDIDGPVYELVDKLREWIHTATGRPWHSMPEPGVYSLETAWGLGEGELLHHLITGARAGVIFWQGDAHAPGLTGLRRLREDGWRIKLVSARDLPGIEDLCFEATESWLASVGAVYDELVLTSRKTEVAWDYLIDDYEKNVLEARAAARGAILLDRHWNRTVALPRAGWEDIPALVAAAACAATAPELDSEYAS